MELVKAKGLVLSYYLSRFNNEALRVLGYRSFSEAFTSLGQIIGENPNNLRNMRDEFDPYFENGRRGWDGRNPSPSRKLIMDMFADEMEEAIAELACDIAKGETPPRIICILDMLNSQTSGTEGRNKMLRDLGELVKSTRQRISDSFIPTEVGLSESFKRAYTSHMRSKNEHVEFMKTTAIITTAGNLNIYVPNQWFVIAAYAVDLIREIIEYRNLTEKIIDKSQPSLTLDDGTSIDKKRIYKGLKDGEEKLLRDKFSIAVAEYLREAGYNDTEIENNSALLLRFISDYEWWYGGKGIERANDFYISPALRVLNLVNASQELVAKLVYAYATEPALYAEIDGISCVSEGGTGEASFDPRSIQEIASIPRREGGRNLIVYGAPGTGKSRFLEDEFGSAPLTRRVVFHPEYSYFDFVGSYKPVPLYEKTDRVFITMDGKSEALGLPYVDYQFVPGPFVQVLIEAWLDPANMHTLIIEELNRANAASVFGEVFQLLDRNSDGSSEYKYEPSRELKQYFVRAGIAEFIKDGVGLPSNMNIVATMNSADQGVNAIDSAFKRRWSFKHLRIDINNAVHKDAEIRYASENISWGAFITAVNEKLKRVRINEDRLIGPYFIKPAELHNRSAIDKLLLYLWDDVLRHKREQGVFSRSITCFADLVDGFETSDVLGIRDYIQYEPKPVISEDDDDIDETT